MWAEQQLAARAGRRRSTDVDLGAAGGSQRRRHRVRRAQQRTPQLDTVHCARRARDTRSKSELEQHLNISVETFSYPYGYHNASVRELVQSAGSLGVRSQACAEHCARRSLCVVTHHHHARYSVERLADLLDGATCAWRCSGAALDERLRVIRRLHCGWRRNV